MAVFDHMHAFSFLLVADRLMELLHFHPVHARAEMMFGVVAVIEPDEIIERVITADTPRNGLVRVSAVMFEIAVERGQAVAQIVECDHHRE